MTKLKKKIAVIALYVLLVIGGVNLAEFPESHAYFTTTKNDAVEFSANVATAYQKFDLRLDDSVAKRPTSAPFRFNFNINKGVSTNYEDVYTINVPEKCVVTKISGGGVTVNNKNTITLPKIESDDPYTYRNGQFTVNMTCELVINEDSYIQVNVNETVKGKTFKYADSSNYHLDYSEYRNEIDGEAESTLGPIAGTNIEIYEEFKVWIQNYVKLYYSEYNASGELSLNPIIQYVIDSTLGKLGTFDKFESALEAARTTETGYYLPGIRITYDATKKNYTFQVEDNLLGYARTFKSNRNNDLFMFYLDSNSKTTINKAFDYYLKEYIYSDEKVISNVKKYIESQTENGIYDLVKGNVTIPGFGKIDDHYYIDKAAVEKYASATYPINVKVDTVEKMKSYINGVLSLKQFKNTPYPAIIKDVMENHDTQPNKNFYASLLRSPSDTRHLEYLIKYVAPTDTEDGYYAVLAVWTDGTNGNNIWFSKFNLPEGLTLSLAQMYTDSAGDFLRLQITSETEITSTYDVSDPIVEIFGLDPVADWSSKYSAYRSDDKKSVFIDLNEPDLYEVLSKTESKLLTELSTVATIEEKEPVKAQTPSNSAPKEEDEVLDSNSGATIIAPIVTDDAIESESAIKDDPSESTDETLEDDKKVADEPLQSEKDDTDTEDTGNYIAENNVSDKPKEMDVEESIIDKIPPIK